jgi:hypothetical protein
MLPEKNIFNYIKRVGDMLCAEVMSMMVMRKR